MAKSKKDKKKDNTLLYVFGAIAVLIIAVIIVVGMYIFGKPPIVRETLEPMVNRIMAQITGLIESIKS
jgi:hypothetical protein